MLHVTTKRMIKGAFLASMITCSLLTAGVQAAEALANDSAPQQKQARKVNIRIVIGTASMAATLEDNPTARDFVSQLPLSLKLHDLSAAEKVSGALPSPLSKEGAPSSDAGAKGDIAYYAPWGNIALYRGAGPNAPGVIRIGKITSGLEALSGHGEVSVTISRDN